MNRYFFGLTDWSDSKWNALPRKAFRAADRRRKEKAVSVAMYSSVTIIFSTISRGLEVLHRPTCPQTAPTPSTLSYVWLDTRRLIEGTHWACAVSQCPIISMYMCFLCPNCMHATDCSCACCHVLTSQVSGCPCASQLTNFPFFVCTCQFSPSLRGVICVPKASLPQVQTLRPHFSCLECVQQPLFLTFVPPDSLWVL